MFYPFLTFGVLPVVLSCYLLILFGIVPLCFILADKTLIISQQNKWREMKGKVLPLLWCHISYNIVHKGAAETV